MTLRAAKCTNCSWNEGRAGEGGKGHPEPPFPFTPESRPSGATANPPPLLRYIGALSVEAGHSLASPHLFARRRRGSPITSVSFNPPPPYPTPHPSVAVVALLREMGVKKSLATLIEAESLLNDGTAVVVFAILIKARSGRILPIAPLVLTLPSHHPNAARWVAQLTALPLPPRYLLLPLPQTQPGCL